MTGVGLEGSHLASANAVAIRAFTTCRPRLDKKFCRKAPGQGICTVEYSSCVAGAALECDDGSGGQCLCFVTTRGHSFCSTLVECINCDSDRQCQERPQGQSGDRCVGCPGCPETDWACARKCPNPATE
jgi:hypothetical protein